MSKITQIQHDNRTGRVIVYVNYRFCASIRQNIWDEMNLREGSEITCSELHRREALIWRKSRKTDVMYPNKQAMKRTMQWLARYLPNLDAKIIDFKFDQGSNLSSNYPSVRNDQNISLYLKKTNIEIMTLEVVSAEIQRGTSYWIRSDKLAYAQSQLNRDAWIVLYRQHPIEKFIWLKPRNKEYKREELISGTKKYFVSFNDKSPEIYSSKYFCDYVQKKVYNMFLDRGSNKFDANSLTSIETTDKNKR